MFTASFSSGAVLNRRTRTVSHRPFHFRKLVPCVVLLLPALAGCSETGLPLPSSVVPPPVEVTYRDSLWGAGKVIQITNNSAHHLYRVRVVGRNFEQGASASVVATEHLSPYKTTEVGWMEFEAWIPVPGEMVEVYCEDQVIPYISSVPR